MASKRAPVPAYPDQQPPPLANAGGLEPPLPLPRQMFFVTAPMAREFLEHIGRARPLSEPDADQYMRDMAAGRWNGRNSENLTFAVAGSHDRDTALCRTYGCGKRELLQGLHRLVAVTRACEQHGMDGVWLEFAYDAKPAAMETLDSGHMRTDNDRRVISHGDYPSLAPNLARRIANWNTPGRLGAPMAGFSPSAGEISEIISRHRALITDACHYGKAAHQRLGLPGSMLAFSYFTFTLIDAGIAAVFLRQVAEGADIARTSPAWMFRDRIARASKMRTEIFTKAGRPNEYRALAVMCATWNEQQEQIVHAQAVIGAQEAGLEPPGPRAARRPHLPKGKDLNPETFPLPAPLARPAADGTAPGTAPGGLISFSELLARGRQ